MRDVPAYLSKQKENATDPDVAEKWRQMEELFDKKLWYQLTVKLQENIVDKSFIKNLDISEMYYEFIADFEHRINPVSLVQIILPIANGMSDGNEAAKFLERIKETVKTSDEASVLAMSGVAEQLLRVKDARDHCVHITRVKEIVAEAQVKLDGLSSITTTHGAFYKTSAHTLREIGDFGGYYKEALRYLGCINVEKMTDQAKLEQALCLALAALLGKEVYNFGELLAHPILKSLQNSSDKWLVDLLFAFNSGDLVKFEALRSHWKTQADLNKNNVQLHEKIRLLCVMEMAFVRPSTQRQLTFAEIATAAKINDDQVERLVMKALSLGLLRGYIDQVEESVTFTWVQPRVLDIKQVNLMSERIRTWELDVSSMRSLAEKEAEEILSH